MNRNVIYGSDLMIFLGGESIAHATSCSVSQTMNTNEIASKDFGRANEVITTTLSWTMTTENLYTADGFTKLLKAQNEGKRVTVVFGHSKDGNNHNYNGNQLQGDAWALDSTHEYLTGSGYISDLGVTAPNGEIATTSATIQGSGALTFTESTNDEADGISGVTDKNDTSTGK